MYFGPWGTCSKRRENGPISPGGANREWRWASPWASCCRCCCPNPGFARGGGRPRGSNGEICAACGRAVPPGKSLFAGQGRTRAKTVFRPPDVGFRDDFLRDLPSPAAGLGRRPAPRHRRSPHPAAIPLADHAGRRLDGGLWLGRQVSDAGKRRLHAALRRRQYGPQRAGAAPRHRAECGLSRRFRPDLSGRRGVARDRRAGAGDL